MAAENPARIIRQIGRRIAQLRRGLEISQSQLADRLGCTLSWVRRVESPGENLTVRSIVEIAAVLGVKGADLWVAPDSMEVGTGRPRQPNKAKSGKGKTKVSPRR